MTLTNKVIIFLGNTKFDGAIKSTSEFIATNLAKNNKVYFIDYPFTLKDYFQSTKEQRLKRASKFSIFSNGLIDTQVNNFKYIITPPVLPINFLPEGIIFKILRSFNEFVISLRLKRVLKQEGIQDFIYINSFNFHYPNISQLIRPNLTVYHCVDPMIVPYDMKHGITAEKELVSQSDIVICTSKELYEEKKLLNKNTYFVANAADLPKKQNAASLKVKHPLLKDLKGPIVGYLGTIERRINYDLVQELVKRHPDKSFVLAGPVTPQFVPESFYKIPNLHIIGTIPYQEVPNMIENFDVAIIPFKKDEVSKTIFPIKLFEYLNAGLPVISTDFNLDLKDFTKEEVVYCETTEKFSACISEALQNNSAEKVVARKALAKMHTWEARANEITAIIERFKRTSTAKLKD